MRKIKLFFSKRELMCVLTFLILISGLCGNVYSQLPQQCAVSITGPERICTPVKDSLYLIAYAGISTGVTYKWSTGASTNQIKAVPSVTTTYIVTATANGCTATASKVVRVSPSPQITISPAVTITPGQSTTLSVKVSGNSVYKYYWSPQASSGRSLAVSPSITTTYFVNVMDTITHCYSMGNVVVTVQNTQPQCTASIIGKESVCSGGLMTDTLTLAAYASGSVSIGNKYIWSTGATTVQINVSPTVTTTFSVTITGDGCTASAAHVVKVIAKPNVVMSPDVTITAGQSTTISANINSYGTFRFYWIPAVTSGNGGLSITVSPSITTTYVLNVYDTINHCYTNGQVVVKVNPAPVCNIYIAGKESICSGDGLTLTVNGTGTVKWSNGSISNILTASPTVTTTYNVTITQSNGCTSSASKVVIVNPKPIANAGSDITIVQGGSANLYANAGSNNSFGFKWINMNKYDSILGQKVIVSPTVTSTYTLFVKSENGCTSTDGIVINVVGKLVVTAGDNKSICVGGSATLKAEGGTMFKWSDAANSTTSSIVVSPSITTTYTVTAFDGFQSATNIVTVFVNNLKVNAGQNQNICKSAQATLNAYAEGAAGTQISFVWNTGEKTATIKVAPTSSATYSVTVTSGGCSASNNVTVNVSDIVANAGMNQTICNGQSANLTATGGTTYKWNTGASNTGASVLVSPTTTTTYTVTVGSGNCSAVSSVIVSVKDKIVASAGANQTICSGQAARLAATGGELYKWSTNDLQANIAVTPATTTTYTVTTSKNGCYETSDVVIFVNPSIKVSINGGIAICKGGIVDLYAQTLNNPNINFQWSTGETSQKLTVSPTATATYFITATLGTCTATNNTVVIVNEAVPASAGPNKTINSESTVQLTASGGDYYIWNLGLQKQTISVTPTITTTYTVTVRNIAGCSATANTVVIVNAPPVANAGSDLTICLLKTCTLNAIGGKYYQWSTGSRQQQIVVNPTSTTTYTVTVTNSTGAKNTDQVIVTVNFATANAGPDKTVCKGQSVTLSGSGSGGTFKWNTGETTSSIVVAPLSMKIYSLVVTNGSCSATDNVIVRVGNMGVNAGPDRTVCKGSAINIIAIASANSNPSFKWSNGGNTADITAKVGVTTSYTVTATSNAGCSATDQVVITVITCKNNDDFDISNTTASVNNNKISTDNGLNLSVYPNPGNGIYNFEAKIAGNSSVRLKVLNILGVKVYETTIKNDSGIFRKNLNLTNLPNGLYMLVVETDAQKVVRNFIKN